MFLQTYGTTYFGKRLPIQTSKQLNTIEGLSVVIETTRVYIVFLEASANGVAYLKPYVVTKNIEAFSEGAGISLGKARVYEMEFIGEFKPGDTIVIDTKHFTVTLNGVNALHLVGNDNFPQLFPGANELIYTDNEGQRTVRVRVIWQDRWM